MTARVIAFCRDETRRMGFTWQSLAIVAWVALVLTVEHYHRANWYWNLIAHAGGVETARYLRYVWLDFPFLLKVAVPMAIIVFVFREPLRSYGLGPGNWRLGLKLSLACYLLYAPLFVIFFTSQGFQEYYAGVARHIHSGQDFLLKEIPAVFFFMVATEFFFRGFLLLGIAKRHGEWVGLLVSIVPFVMWHYNKPAIETFGSFPVGLALGYVVLRTESIWYAVLLHASIALALNGLLLLC